MQFLRILVKKMRRTFSPDELFDQLPREWKEEAQRKRKRTRTRIGRAIDRAYEKLREVGLNSLCLHFDDAIKPYSGKAIGYSPPEDIDWLT